jgi:CDP-paratose 2-epimerase
MGKVDQGVVVLWVARHFWKKPLAYIGFGGQGKQVRDILHVDDLFRLLDYQTHSIQDFSGQTFNVGGGSSVSLSLKELTDICEKVIGNTIPIESISESRQADIRVYITDNSKITALSGWTPQISSTRIIEEIFQWIRANETDLKPILS